MENTIFGLNEIQRLYALKWLISTKIQYIGSGRTTLLARAFIDEAISTGKPVFVFDHRSPGDYNHNRNSIIRNIKEFLCNEYKDYEFKLSGLNGSLVMKKKRTTRNQNHCN